jgi:hypothetical protein
MGGLFPWGITLIGAHAVKPTLGGQAVGGLRTHGLT